MNTEDQGSAFVCLPDRHSVYQLSVEPASTVGTISGTVKLQTLVVMLTGGQVTVGLTSSRTVTVATQVPTPIPPASVTVSVTSTDGTSAQVNASCDAE
jgi:hypothetical protein